MLNVRFTDPCIINFFKEANTAEVDTAASWDQLGGKILKAIGDIYCAHCYENFLLSKNDLENELMVCRRRINWADLYESVTVIQRQNVIDTRKSYHKITSERMNYITSMVIRMIKREPTEKAKILKELGELPLDAYIQKSTFETDDLFSTYYDEITKNT